MDKWLCWGSMGVAGLLLLLFILDIPLGIPFGAINNLAQVVDHPQVKARGTLVEMEHPRAGKVKMVGAPVRLSVTPGSVRTPSPMLGEHTEAVLREVLGMSPEAVAALRDEGVIGGPSTR